MSPALDEHHVRLDQPRLLAVVLAPGPRIERADELDPAMRLGGGNLRRPRQVFHVPLLQQVKMPVHDQRRHFHAAPPLLDALFGLGAEAAVDILFRSLRFSRPFGKQLGKLMLLGRNLDQQALAQIARAHAGRVKLLHQFDAPAQQLKRCRPFRLLLGTDEGRRQLFFAAGQVPVSVQIADDELRRLAQAWVQGQSSQLPRQVIGQSRRLGEEVLERGLLVLLILRLRAIAGVQIILEVRSEIDLVEGILGRGRRLLDVTLFDSALQPFLAARDLIQHRNRLVNLFQDGVFHHLGIDHLLQFELVERQHAHHLHQTRSEDLALRYFEAQFGLQQRHRRNSIPVWTHRQCTEVRKRLKGKMPRADRIVPDWAARNLGISVWNSCKFFARREIDGTGVSFPQAPLVKILISPA